MRKVLIIVLLLCLLCGCRRSVPVVEFESVEVVETESVRSVPDVYYCPPNQTSQHKIVNLDVGEVSNMSFVMEWIEISIPKDAQLISYFMYGDKLYYSYNYFSYIYNDLENYEKLVLDEAYNTQLMCYDTKTKATTQIMSYPVGVEISRINVSGEYLFFRLCYLNDITLDDISYKYEEVIIRICEDGYEEVELSNSAMTEQYFLSISNGMYALTTNYTVRDTINKIAKVNLEKDLAEFIMFKNEYEEVYYSKGYLICKESSGDLHKIDIYDLNGEKIMGFKVTSYVNNVVCNDKLCAWTTDDLEGEGQLLYVYTYEHDEIFVMECNEYNLWIECDGDRVYFGGDISTGISCYDSHLNTLCKSLITGMYYYNVSGEEKGIFGLVSEPNSSTLERTDGKEVCSFYRIK